MSRRKRKGRSAKNLASLLFGVSLIIVSTAAIGAFLYFLNTTKQVALDDELCPIDGASQLLSILIDVSDPMPPIGREQVLAQLSDQVLNSNHAERVVISLFGADELDTRTIFSGCNPGRGKDADELISNPKLIEKRYLEAFEAPVGAALQSIPQNSSETSPIMAALQRWAVQSLTKTSQQTIPTQLIIISDMIENTKNYSQYRSGSDFDAFKLTEAYRLFETDFHNTNIEIWYIQRLPKKLNDLDHIEFWSNWFRSNRAGTFSVKKIQIGSR